MLGMAAIAPGAASLTVTSSGTMAPPTPRDAKGAKGGKAGWEVLSSAVKDANRLMRVASIMQRRDYKRSHKKFGTALAPTANSSRWDVQEAYRSLFNAPMAPEAAPRDGAQTQSDGQGVTSTITDDPFLTPEYEDILTKEWKIRHSHFSSKLRSRFAAQGIDEKEQARKERAEMWEKLRRKFRMLR